MRPTIPPATSPRASGSGAPVSHVPARRRVQVANVGVTFPGSPVATTMRPPIVFATAALRAAGSGGSATQTSSPGSYRLTSAVAAPQQPPSSTLPPMTMMRPSTTKLEEQMWLRAWGRSAARRQVSVAGS
jgi:hypothetical protein